MPTDRSVREYRMVLGWANGVKDGVNREFWKALTTEDTKGHKGNQNHFVYRSVLLVKDDFDFPKEKRPDFSPSAIRSQ